MIERTVEENRLDPTRIAAVRATGLLDSQPEPAFDRLTQLAAKLTGAPVTFVSLLDENRDFYKACFGFPEPLASERQLLGTTFCHYAIVSAGPLVIEDTLAHPIFRDVPTVKSLSVRAYLGVPLVSSEGLALGSFCAIAFEPRPWTPLDIEVMVELAAATLREIELRTALASAAEARNSLDAERRLLDAAMQQMPAGMLIADPQGNVTFSNDRAAAILGIIPGNVLTTSRVVLAQHLDGRPYLPAESPLSRAVVDGEVVIDERMRYESPAGLRMVSVSATPVRDAHGLLIAGVLTIHDITERERLVSDLAEERSRLQTLIEQVPAGVLVAEAPSGRIIMGNRQGEALLGHPTIFSPNVEAYGAWKAFHPDGRRMEPEEWPLARAVRGEAARGEEVQYLRGDGVLLWIRIHAAPVVDADGAVIGGIVAFYDIDEQRRMQVENARLYEEAQQANQAKDNFFAAVSHELRTPMTSIIGWSRLLKMEAIDNPSVTEAAEAIASSAALQAQLVDDLLDVSRISQGKIELSPQPIDMNELLREAVRAAQPAAMSKGIRLRSTFADVPVIDGDHARLRQVFGNLLSNAVKFTPAGGLIEVTSELCGDDICVMVRDTGRGIAPELIPFVFDRGRQATSAELGGLGLGLTIVHYLVERHGGTVRAASEGEGKGATFTVTLPAATSAGQSR